MRLSDSVRLGKATSWVAFLVMGNGNRIMDRHTLAEMPLDELWELHKSAASILASGLETQKRELEDRLRRFGADVAHREEKPRRRYPPVLPKFRNPAKPHKDGLDEAGDHIG